MGKEHLTKALGVARVVGVAVATFAATALACSSGASAASAPHLRVVSVSPAPASTNVRGTTPITIRFSSAVAQSTALPTLSPTVPGSWTESGNDLVFEPTGAYPPDGPVTISIPGGTAGVVGVDGAHLKGSRTETFTTGPGSILRAEQLLAELGYLPVMWHARAPLVRTLAESERAIYIPPPGRFVFLGDPPAALRSLWSPGVTSQLLASALNSFDRIEHLTTGSGLSASFWATLSRLGRRPGSHRNADGFTYALVNKNVGNNNPETITIYQDGRVALSSPANTGISASPTADGTYAVYLRFVNQVMSGKSPFGGTYSDPVSWVDYFNGSDAVHYIARSQYGYPQSFGCVELPWAAAERAYGLLQLGTLVTVES